MDSETKMARAGLTWMAQLVVRMKTPEVCALVVRPGGQPAMTEMPLTLDGTVRGLP